MFLGESREKVKKKILYYKNERNKIESYLIRVMFCKLLELIEVNYVKNKRIKVTMEE